MNEEKSSVPFLTLDPNATAAAVQEAPAAEEAKEEVTEEVQAAKLELESLTPAEQAAVKEFSEKINVLNTEQVMNYGSAAQKNISEFSDAALASVRTKDLGEVGHMLGDLVIELKGLNFDTEEKKGILGIFKKSTQSIASLKAQYDKAEVNVDKIVEALQNHEVTLLKDISMMDKMYEKNSEYMKELTMYILAGKLKIEHLRQVELPEYVAKANASGLPEDAQAANDFANMIGRFEKKIHDLELTRMISVQMAPQIRMVQNNDSLMAEKIRTSIVNTIPLWKNQMVMAMSLYHSERPAPEERRDPASGQRCDREGIRARYRGSRDAPQDQRRADLHAGGSQQDPERRPCPARGGGGRAREDRGRSQAEAAGDEGLIPSVPYSRLFPERSKP